MKRKKRIGTIGKAIGCLFFLMVSLFPIYWLVAMAIRPTDEMRVPVAGTSSQNFAPPRSAAVMRPTCSSAEMATSVRPVLQRTPK